MWSVWPSRKQGRGLLTRYEQIKYFKEKRVMEYKRDQTYAQIRKEDAAMAAKSKAEKKEKGGIGSWFS